MVNPAQVLLSVVYGFSAFLAEQPQVLPLLRCAPVLQGSCCNNALSRMVNPAQVLLSVVYGFSAFLAEQPQVLQSFRCAPAEQGSCCTSTLPRAVSPAQVLFSVVCGFSVILRDKRRACRYSALIEYAYVKIIVIVHLSGCKSFYFLPVGFTVFVVNADCKKSRFYGSLNRHQHIFKYYCFACF